MVSGAGADSRFHLILEAAGMMEDDGDGAFMRMIKGTLRSAEHGVTIATLRGSWPATSREEPMPRNASLTPERPQQPDCVPFATSLEQVGLLGQRRWKLPNQEPRHAVNWDPEAESAASGGDKRKHG